MRVLSVYDDKNGSGSSLVLEDGAPDYHDLLAENERLKQELEEARANAQDIWETVEDVCCSARLECPVCKKPLPCLCDKSK